MLQVKCNCPGLKLGTVLWPDTIPFCGLIPYHSVAWYHTMPLTPKVHLLLQWLFLCTCHVLYTAEDHCQRVSMVVEEGKQGSGCDMQPVSCSLQGCHLCVEATQHDRWLPESERGHERREARQWVWHAANQTSCMSLCIIILTCIFHCLQPHFLFTHPSLSRVLRSNSQFPASTRSLVGEATGGTSA